jgi:hypothetical protein
MIVLKHLSRIKQQQSVSATLRTIISTNRNRQRQRQAEQELLEKQIATSAGYESKHHPGRRYPKLPDLRYHAKWKTEYGTEIRAPFVGRSDAILQTLHTLYYTHNELDAKPTYSIISTSMGMGKTAFLSYACIKAIESMYSYFVCCDSSI